MGVVVNGTNVNIIMVNGSNVQNVYVNGIQVWPESTPKLTFHSADSFTLETANASKNWDGTIEYSTNAQTWATWDGTTSLTAASDDGVYYIYLRGTGNTYITAQSQGNGFVITGSGVSCDGDIRALFEYADVENATPTDYALHRLFYGQNALVSCPEILFASLPQNVFRQMFYHCENLETIPAIVAVEINSNAMYQMLNGCQKIKVSDTQTGEYQTPYRIPMEGTATIIGTNQTRGMLGNTGGTFTSNPSINTTYYTSNAVVE